MILRNFGTSGCSVPVIGQGTWDMPERGEPRDEAKKALVTGIHKGLVHIDTAEMYGSGLAEELVGEAIRGIHRDELFLVSKVLPTNATYKGTIKACELSLRRMKCDFLDCYLLHWRGNYPLEDTVGALETLVQQGKIRFLGVSNFDVEDLKEASAYLSKERIVCNQVLYHLKERGIERRVIPYCEEQEIAVVAYTPFGQRPMPEPGSAGGRVLAKIAAKYGVTPRQVVLAFLTRNPILFTIPKASKTEHVLENAKAGELTLDRDDIEAIDEVFPAPGKDTPLATL
jgi:diketogulonate reductase-like aldo/keto reductase